MIVGYIVEGDQGAYELCVGSYYPKGGVLLLGRHPTMFSTLARAKGAIKRTLKYAADEGWEWESFGHRVRSLRPEPSLRGQRYGG